MAHTGSNGLQRRCPGGKPFPDVEAARYALSKSGDTSREPSECPRCGQVHLTKVAQSTGVNRSSSLRAQSPKRAALAPARRAFVAGHLAEIPLCEAGLSGCEGKATEVHETLRRSQGGDILDDTITLSLCHACHRWITEHPDEAERMRLSTWGLRAPSEPEPPAPTLQEFASQVAGIRERQRKTGGTGNATC
jgi:hypothetical protein